MPNERISPPKHILVPTDFTGASDNARLYGLMLAEAFHANLHLLHVIPEPVELGLKPDDVRWSELMEDTRRSAQERLDRLLTAEERDKCHARVVVESGRPAATIVDYAKRHSIDVIVIATHGRGEIERLWFGSVAQGVLLRAPCPVVAVQPQARPPASVMQA